jgi:hypothetical protein
VGNNFPILDRIRDNLSFFNVPGINTFIGVISKAIGEGIPDPLLIFLVILLVRPTIFGVQNP